MTISRRARSAVLIASVQLCVLFGAELASAETPRIPWDKSLTVTRTSSDEDIKTVLRSLLQANGVSVIFGPDVQGNVSFRLDKVPISTAFEQLVDEHSLAYVYDGSTNTVAISSLAEGDRAKPTTFVPLDQVTYGEVTRAMESFGLSSRGVKYDSGTRTVAISGDTQHVQEIADLIKTLETSHQKQRDRLGADRTRELQLKRAELAQQAYEDIKKFEVKVIPLRFTDVGPTTKQFQGRTVTIPGIMDTLTSILGISPLPQGAAPPPATAPSALGPESPGDALPDATLLGEAQQLGHPRISIDQRTNSVVVQGSVEAIAAVEKIIHALDRPLQMSRSKSRLRRPIWAWRVNWAWIGAARRSTPTAHRCRAPSTPGPMLRGSATMWRDRGSIPPGWTL
jgi:type II secretory pathway component GspD/PulD (secretin)